MTNSTNDNCAHSVALLPLFFWMKSSPRSCIEHSPSQNVFRMYSTGRLCCVSLVALTIFLWGPRGFLLGFRADTHSTTTLPRNESDLSQKPKDPHPHTRRLPPHFECIYAFNRTSRVEPTSQVWFCMVDIKVGIFVTYYTGPQCAQGIYIFYIEFFCRHNIVSILSDPALIVSVAKVCFLTAKHIFFLLVLTHIPSRAIFPSSLWLSSVVYIVTYSCLSVASLCGTLGITHNY